MTGWNRWYRQPYLNLSVDVGDCFKVVRQFRVPPQVYSLFVVTLAVLEVPGEKRRAIRSLIIFIKEYSLHENVPPGKFYAAV